MVVGGAIVTASGLLEVGSLGLATPVMLLTGAAGVALMANGADVVVTGKNEVLSGQPQKTMTEQLLIGSGQSEAQASSTQNGVTLAANMWNLANAARNPCPAAPAVIPASTGPVLTGFSGSQSRMIANALQSLKNAGYNTGLFKALVRAKMPAGTRGMSLSDGAAVGGEAFSSQGMLNHVLEEELRHLQQTASGMRGSYGPGTSQALEEAAGSDRLFPEP